MVSMIKFYTAKSHTPSKNKIAKRRRGEKFRATLSGRSKRRLPMRQISLRWARSPRITTTERYSETNFALEGSHPVVTLNVGGLDANVRRATSNPDFKATVLDNVRSLVTVMNSAK